MFFERRFAVDRQRYTNEFSISIHFLLTFLTQRHFLILHFKNCWGMGVRDVWDCLSGQASLTIGPWYPRQPLTNRK